MSNESLIVNENLNVKRCVEKDEKEKEMKR